MWATPAKPASPDDGDLQDLTRFLPRYAANGRSGPARDGRSARHCLRSATLNSLPLWRMLKPVRKRRRHEPAAASEPERCGRGHLSPHNQGGEMRRALIPFIALVAVAVMASV